MNSGSQPSVGLNPHSYLLLVKWLQARSLLVLGLRVPLYQMGSSQCQLSEGPEGYTHNMHRVRR